MTTQRTRITAEDDRHVTITYVDNWSGEMVTREFWVPVGGGYVREGDQQVCELLASTGPTLRTYGEPLIHTIRAEYRRMRRAEAAEARRWEM